MRLVKEGLHATHTRTHRRDVLFCRSSSASEQRFTEHAGSDADRLGRCKPETVGKTQGVADTFEPFRRLEVA
jgi:hypothetical protein